MPLHGGLVVRLTIPHPPNQVRNAVALLYASLLLSTVEFFASGTWAEDAFDWGMQVLFGIATVAYGYVIFLLSRRANWARILLLVLVAASTAATFAWPPDIEDDAWWSVLLVAAGAVADVVAMVWLFSGAGHAWFKRAEAHADRDAGPL